MIAPVRQPLPTQVQINETDSIPVLHVLKDDIERAITKIETDLEFAPGSEEWERRARNALAYHRHTEKMLSRRIGVLMRAEDAERPWSGRKRPGDMIDPLTAEVLKDRPYMSPADLKTTVEVDAATEWLALRINAVQADREDEISLPAASRDEAFLAATGAVLRLLKGYRSAVQNRRGEISRALKKANMERSIVRDTSRERLFVDASREILDRASFLAIWDRVDQIQASQA